MPALTIVTLAVAAALVDADGALDLVEDAVRDAAVFLELLQALLFESVQRRAGPCGVVRDLQHNKCKSSTHHVDNRGSGSF